MELIFPPFRYLSKYADKHTLLMLMPDYRQIAAVYPTISTSFRSAFAFIFTPHVFILQVRLIWIVIKLTLPTIYPHSPYSNPLVMNPINL